MSRLGSTAARLKLKGIDGGPHKRWNMWFNSTTRRTLPGLELLVVVRWKQWTTRKGASRGAAWLSSARVVRCWVKSRNERNPYSMLLIPQGMHSSRTAFDKKEEGGDDVKSSWPLCPGLHTCYNAGTEGSNTARWSQTHKAGPSSDCGLQLAHMKAESLVIADQQAAVNTFPGLVHTARHTTKARCNISR